MLKWALSEAERAPDRHDEHREKMKASTDRHEENREKMKASTDRHEEHREKMKARPKRHEEHREKMKATLTHSLTILMLRFILLRRRRNMYVKNIVLAAQKTM